MADDRSRPATSDGEGPADVGLPATPGWQAGKRQPGLGDFFWIGTACAISIVAGGGIGYAIDDAAGTLPWITIGGLAFGVLCAVLLAVNQFRKYV